MNKLLKIKYLYTDLPELVIPQNGDIGIDLYSNEDVVIPFQRSKLVHTGVCLQPPKCYWLQVQDRSSVSKFCHAMAGIIDTSYTGEVLIRMYCHTPKWEEVKNTDVNGLVWYNDEGYIIKRGDKIAQLIIRKSYNYEFLLNKVEELEITERKDKGFGSTGV